MAKQFIDGAEGEFEVQAILYMGLTAMGYRVRGEVPSSTVFPLLKFERGARFDLVIFDDKWKPVEIIEAKHPGYSIPFTASMQCQRYRRYGIPVKFAKSSKTAFALLVEYNDRLDAYSALYGKSETAAQIMTFMGLLQMDAP
jgi:hypothetical protein